MIDISIHFILSLKLICTPAWSLQAESLVLIKAPINMYYDFHKEIMKSNYEEAQNNCRYINSTIQTYYDQVENSNFLFLQRYFFRTIWLI